jgi:AcrR family transcriptional regulator
MSSPEEPRFRQIVADLRHRIESGELTPGDRVPSTRQITRQWNVAMATATKALADLQRRGLVHVVPGIGTVVNGTPVVHAKESAPMGRRPATADQVLTADRIVTAAIQVADAEGLAAVSMRRVASDLEVATMSLYRHVADKDDLLIRMMDAAFTQWPLPSDLPSQWRAALEVVGRRLWSMFREHPWLAPAISVTRPQPLANGMALTEWVLTTLDREGLDPSTALTTHLTLFNYVRATAMNIELEAEAEADTGLDNEQWLNAHQPALDAIVVTGRFPMLERLITDSYDFDLDALFEFGLHRLLDGISVLLAEKADAEAAES